MTESQARMTAEFLEEMGYEAKVHLDYSGRGMMGKTCVGISTDASGVVLGFAFAQCFRQTDLVESLNEVILPQRRDSLGLYVIYY